MDESPPNIAPTFIRYKHVIPRLKYNKFFTNLSQFHAHIWSSIKLGMSSKLFIVVFSDF